MQLGITLDAQHTTYIIFSFFSRLTRRDKEKKFSLFFKNSELLIKKKLL